MSIENMNAHIDKIEDALNQLSRNPKGGWTEIMKADKVPYYGTITGALRKRGIAVSDGTGLKWVGDPPTRTLAALIYEEAKGATMRPRKSKQNNKKSSGANEPATTNGRGEAWIRLSEENKDSQNTIFALSPSTSFRVAESQDSPREFPSDELLVRALAVMEKAIRHQVPDPVAFTLEVIKDARI